MLNVDNIYIIHHTKLADRKTRLDASLRENNIRAEYIIEHDQEDLSDELISGNYECDEDLYNSKILPIYKSKFSSFKELSTAEISCTFKHRAAIEKIADATLGPLIGGESHIDVEQRVLLHTRCRTLHQKEGSHTYLKNLLPPR